MKLGNINQNKVVRSGDFETSNFNIEATAKAFSILSDGLYSNKIKAVVRELSTNAYDAHVEAGNADVPFEVCLPTQLNHEFHVRDFGNGLSHEDATTLYTTYFRSTKTSSNDAVGCLGLGSKSPFAYTDNFIVESFHAGTHSVYTAYKNEDNEPVFSLLSSEPSDEPSGLKVTINTKQEDRWDFRTEAEVIFEHFTVRPTMVGADAHYHDYEYTFSGDGWAISEYGGNRVIMGQISYPIDREHFSGVTREILDSGFSIVVLADIGDMDITPSRESLSYNPKTIEAINTAVNRLVEDIALNLAVEIDECDSLWKARKALTVASRQFRLVSSLSHIFEEVNEWKGAPIFEDAYKTLKTPEGFMKGYKWDAYKEKVANFNPTSVRAEHILVYNDAPAAVSRVKLMIEEGRCPTHGRDSAFLISKDWPLSTVHSILGTTDEDIVLASSLAKPDSTRTFTGARGKRGVATIPTATGERYNSWVDTQVDMNDGVHYYIEVSRDNLINRKNGWTLYRVEETIRALLQVDPDLDVTNFHKLTPSVAKNKKIASKDNWYSLTNKLEDLVRAKVADNIHNIARVSSKPENYINGLSHDDIKDLADETGCPVFTSIHKDLVAGEEIEIGYGWKILTSRAEALGIMKDFSEEVKELSIDWSNNIDIMDKTYPMLKHTCSWGMNADQRDDIINYINMIRG